MSGVTIVVDPQLIARTLTKAHQRDEVTAVDHFDHSDRNGEVAVLPQLEWVEAEDAEAAVGADCEEALIGVEAHAQDLLFGSVHSLGNIYNEA
jgi:hypothetical protein